jgi:hypothetical protein
MPIKKPEPTRAQKIFGKDYGNASILNERPEHLRSTNPDHDKILFQKYKGMRRQQTKVIKSVLH